MNHKTLKERENEIGKVIEDLVSVSEEKFLQEEVSKSSSIDTGKIYEKLVDRHKSLLYRYDFQNDIKKCSMVKYDVNIFCKFCNYVTYAKYISCSYLQIKYQKFFVHDFK